MSVQDSKTRLMARIWQEIVGSGVNTSAIPREQWDVLVDRIANGVLVEFDSLLDRVSSPAEPGHGLVAATAGAAQADEEVLWEGRPFLSIGERYVVTSERIRLITGLVGKEREDIELIRVRDVDHHQGVSERMLNIGDIYLHTADPSRQDVTLRNVADPEKVHEIIRRAMLNARRRYPFVFEQNM